MTHQEIISRIEAIAGDRDLLSVKEMRAILGISTSAAYALVRTGVVRSIDVGKTHHIPRSLLIRYMEDVQNDNKH